MLGDSSPAACQLDSISLEQLLGLDQPPGVVSQPYPDVVPFPNAEAALAPRAGAEHGASQCGGAQGLQAGTIPAPSSAAKPVSAQFWLFQSGF